MTTLTVLLIDDHSVVAEGLESLLSTHSDIVVVASVRSVRAGVDAFREHRPDVVLMDISMPEVDGIEGTRRILAIDSAAKVIALTGFATEHLVADVVEAGAAGYMLKSVSGPELTDAIRSVAAGQAAFSDEALALLIARRQGARVGDDLTPRELDVLEGLVNGRSNKQIGHHLGLSPGTVRVHVSSILSKLHVDNRTAAAMLAQQQRLTSAGGQNTDDEVHRIDPRGR